MLINEVESILGLTKKSIRYYEDIGLIHPKRNDSNGYRSYTDDDIKVLKLIKFLRSLDVPINDIKQFSAGKITLQKCINERVTHIDSSINNLNLVKSMCLDISNIEGSFYEIDIDKYFKKMNVLSKQGIINRKGDDFMARKYVGPVLSGLFFLILFGAIIGVMFYAQSVDPIPFVFFVFMISLFFIPIIGILVNLVARIREIKGGEEDEASKY